MRTRWMLAACVLVLFACDKKADTGSQGPAVTVGPEGASVAGRGAAVAAKTPFGAAPPAATPIIGPCQQLSARCSKCTLPLPKQTCTLAVASGDAKSCRDGLNDKDVQSNCK